MTDPATPRRLPIRRVESAPEQIGRAVKEWILDGTLRPGDRLPTEEQMTTLFGVSRPTIREALRELRAAHVLTSGRGRTGGYRVAEVSVRTLGASVAEAISLSLQMQTLTYAQLFEVRVALELQAAGAAASGAPTTIWRAPWRSPSCSGCRLRPRTSSGAISPSTVLSPRRPTTR